MKVEIAIFTDVETVCDLYSKYHFLIHSTQAYKQKYMSTLKKNTLLLFRTRTVLYPIITN